MIVERLIVAHHVGLARGVVFALVSLDDGSTYVLMGPHWTWQKIAPPIVERRVNG